MSSHKATDSDDDDEGFAPFIPVLAPPAQTLKRPREPSVEEEEAEIAAPAPEAATPEGTKNDDSPHAAVSSAWDRYVHLGLPSAGLYYRSFQHTSEPTPQPPAQTEEERLRADDNGDSASCSNNNNSNTDSHADNAGLTPAPSYVIDDMLAIPDALGELLCTVDENGVVRLLRKLPRGIFFWGEVDRIFGNAHSVVREAVAHNEAANTPHTSCRYYLRSSTEVQSLVCVRVMEMWAASASSTVEVEVEVRLVNPYTLTVEGHHAFAFLAPVRHGQPCYTPQPTLLVHKYDLYLALFTALVPSQDATEASPTTEGLAQGVVIVPCQPAKSLGTSHNNNCNNNNNNNTSHLSAAGSRIAYVEAAPLSVMSRVVCCTQMSSASQSRHRDWQKVPRPCVLLGAGGTVDYAVLDIAASDQEADTSSSGHAQSGGTPYRKNGIGLRVTGGLATCPPHSADHRIWSQLIGFKRRVNTDFFALVKLARALDAGANERAAVVMPLGLRFTPNGGEFVVVSARVSLRVASETAASSSSSSSSGLIMSVQTCLHWFDFASGKLLGAYVAPTDACDGKLISVPIHFPNTPSTTTCADAWSTRMAQFMECGRAGAACQPQLDLHVLFSVCPGAPSGVEYYILVPEVSCVELLPGLVMPASSSSSASSNMNRSVGSSVHGRLVHVFRAALAPQDATADGSHPASPVSRVVIESLDHAVGEMEVRVRSGLVPSPEARGGKALLARSSERYTAALIAAENAAPLSRTALPGVLRGTATVPLWLLTSTVMPSQSLKNFIARSPVGAALTPDELKHLLVVPSRSEEESRRAAAAGESGATPSSTTFTDPLLCTTSLAPPAASALIIYSSVPAETNPTTAVAAQWLHRLHEAPHEGHSAQDDEDADGEKKNQEAHTQSGSLVKSSVNLMARQRAWNTLLRELSDRRQFACGDLLAGTHHAHPQPPAHQQQHASGTTGDGSGDAQENAEEASEALPSISAAMRVAANAPATVAASPALDEKGKVLALLGPALATLPPSSPSSAAAGSAPYVPKEHGLVHIRGYGTVRLAFLPQIAPLAVENFQRLARQGYYNSLTFHRVIPLTIVQGGCPRGDGTGGVCVFADQDTFPDENLDVFPFFSHTEHAWLCMANAGENTNGSQFFFTVPGGQEMPWLNGHHTVFGFVVGGASLLTAMSEVPRDEEDKPRIPIVMERIDIY